MIISGCSASTGTVASLPRRPAVRSWYHTSRPGVQGVWAVPRRRTTTTCSTSGAAATASSATAFMPTAWPRR